MTEVLAIPTTVKGVLALPFTRMADWVDMPDQPGIYFAIIDRKHLVYVGVTGVSMRRRWRHHNHRWRLRTFGDVTVVCITIYDDHARYDAEIEAIKRFDPVMNDTPGFCVVMDQTEQGKRFYRVSWEDGQARVSGRPRKQPPAPPPA